MSDVREVRLFAFHIKVTGIHFLNVCPERNTWNVAELPLAQPDALVRTLKRQTEKFLV